MSYWSLADLQAFIGTQVVRECYDDQRQGYPNPTLIAAHQALSDSMVDGKLIRVYPGPFPVVQNFPSWAPSTSYAIGAKVIPLASPNGFAFQAVKVAGTSGPTEPAWPAQLTSTVTDGSLTWVCISLTPELVKMASLLWGRVFAYERHPEYVKRYGGKPRDEATKFLDQLVAARSYLADALSMSAPDNVGGVITNNGPRMTLDGGSNGVSGTGDF